MKRTWIGAIIGAAMLALAAPAGAATVAGTGIVNATGSIAAGDSALSFDVSDLSNGAEGINGASFKPGKRYYDYVFSFTLGGAADVIAGATATAGTNVLESHAALFSGSPANTALMVGGSPDPLTGLTNLDNLLVATSSTGNSVLNTLTAANLAAGTYYLRFFGVIAGNSDINSHLTALAGTVTATPIPAALPLFISALGLVGFAGWRRKAAALSVAAA
jgi:hypothetical protein